MDLPVISKGALPFAGVQQVVERRRVHHTGRHLPLLFQSDERREEGNAADEVLGTVDRVNNPAGLTPTRALTQLLTEKAMVRKARAQELENLGLTFAIRPRHRGTVGLSLDRQVGTEIMQSNLSGRPGCLDCRPQNLVHASEAFSHHKKQESEMTKKNRRNGDGEKRRKARNVFLSPILRFP